MVIDPSGIIITNYHVIEGSKTAKATFKSGKVAKILGYLAIDPKRDMAVLRLEKMSDPLPAITFAKELPRKGEKVAAFGNPKGFSFTTSEGIVSAIRSGKELERRCSVPNFTRSSATTSPPPGCKPRRPFRAETAADR